MRLFVRVWKHTKGSEPETDGGKYFPLNNDGYAEAKKYYYNFTKRLDVSKPTPEPYFTADEVEMVW